MSSLLDPSLPSLVIRPSSSGSTVEVFDAQGRKIYLYGRTSLQHTPYQATLEDAHFGAAVSSISTSSDAQSKVKQIQLFNPDVELELRSVGRMSYTWQFTWESELYQWKQPRLSSKEFTCFCVRKPDPDVDVSRARLGDTKSPTIITFQQYNIDRFSIKDHKGLEIILLTTLLSFLDASQEREDRPIMISSSADDTTTMVPLAPPAVPPKPQNLREEIGFGDFEEPPDPNELTITSAHSVETYAQKSFDLLLDSSMLFVILRAKSPEMIPKTVKVAEEVKRLRHREGWESMDEEQEIFQYVVENIEDPTGPSKLETKPTAGSIRRPPKVIDLNDPVPATSGPSPSSL
ncbi:hypothetical protein [Phaffia rhodozyma]|uniref:Uncharacterized protein n=1 Tax=Phaffia rhodozyma TaxID=264483 RepID=A0A0F7SFL8_PHARH|nr:hypothetical protein [Phaffia rhodozyma]